MTLTISTFEQGTDEWDEARRGIVTASTAHSLITTKTVEVANNVESRALTATLVCERITGWTDDRYVSFDMLRGHDVEPIARDLYAETRDTTVDEVGFMVRDDWGYRIGYSPDGLVGEDGLLEVKSRRPKEHLATILANEPPAENMAQLQCGLLVSGREWIDYVSFCGGMPLYVTRVLPDPRWREAIVTAVARFEEAAANMAARYRLLTAGMPTTERLPNYLDVELKL
jgi:hypothetical protein